MVLDCPSVDQFTRSPSSPVIITASASPFLPRESYVLASVILPTEQDDETLRRKSFLEPELNNLFVECREQDWDGRGSLPVSFAAYKAAQKFINRLPAATPKPDLSADSDGCITFEWRPAANKILYVSVSPQLRIDYAVIVGESKAHGSEPFFDKLPESFEFWLRCVCA